MSLNTEWKIQKSGSCCDLCSKPLKPGDTFYSVLFVQAADYDRRNFCTSCFQERDPSNFFYFWKTTLPLEEKAPKKTHPTLDPIALYEFFQRLADQKDSSRQAFRYVLALMLARKRILVLERSREEDGSVFLTFVNKQDKEEHEVQQPLLNDRELEAINDELGVLLGLPPAKKEEETAMAASIE